jgi:DNA-binding XRE family transcriptional regulator
MKPYPLVGLNHFTVPIAMARPQVKTAQEGNPIRRTHAPQAKLALVVPMKKLKKPGGPRSATAIDTYIGARMRERRIALQLTQAGLGEKLGVTFQQIQKYESGVNRVSAARLFDICEALDVSLASMFERKLNNKHLLKPI